MKAVKWYQIPELVEAKKRLLQRRIDEALLEIERLEEVIDVAIKEIRQIEDKEV